MSYGIWDKAKKDRLPHQFFEKAYRREDLAAWDARWQELSREARTTFLNEVKGPNERETATTINSGVPVDKIAPTALQELVEKGFVKVVASKGKTKPDRVVAVATLFAFATRVRSLHRLGMLNPANLNNIAKYIDFNAYLREFPIVLQDILRKAGLQETWPLDVILNRYVVQHRWPGRVTQVLKDKIADRIVSALLEAEKPISLIELPDNVESKDPKEVRTALNALIARLVVFEDLNPESFDLVVGLLPAVRDDIARMARPRERPPLIPCDSPRDLGPEGSLVVEDLRTFLLEITSDPPRLRKDLTFFAKEIDRFLEALAPLAASISETLGWQPAWRVNEAGAWARLLKLVKDSTEGTQVTMRLSPKGDRWLAGPLLDQYSQIFESIIPPVEAKDRYVSGASFLYSGTGVYDIYDAGDARFLGSSITAFKTHKGRPRPYWNAKPEDHKIVREAIFRTLTELPLEIFYPMENVLKHLTYGRHNPLNLGMALDQVEVYRSSRAVPPIEEEREQAGQELLYALIRNRLLPLGCFRAAIDHNDRLCIARTSRLEAYFGRKVSGTNLVGVSEAESRVVVQPDFSVIIIGLSPAPAAALSPFCERSTRGGHPGALVLKLTRESVVRAIAQGMKPAEIVDRLNRHASIEVPANVLKEVENWSKWVRHVTTEPITVLRCPDRDTADRAMAALKKQAERINEILIAIDMIKISSVERNKLREHGIIVKSDLEKVKKSSSSGKKKWNY